MSRIKKDIKELLELAKLTNDESVFQQKHRYKKFKDKYHVEMVSYVPELMIGLHNNDFCNESVFWGKKIIENIRVCDKEERAVAFHCMVTSLYRLEDLESVLDNGKKFLDNDKLLLYTPDSIANKKQIRRKKAVIALMKIASCELNMKQEAMKYTKELLKILVGQYNASEIEKHELLLAYHELIDLQIQLGDSKSAKKIIDRRLTLFNLNSPHPKDVLSSMREEGYEKILPLGIFMSNDNEHCIREFRKIRLSVESYEHWVKMMRTFFYVGKICWQKHIFGYSCPSNMTWSNISLKVYYEIVQHIRIYFRLEEQSENNTLLSDDHIIAIVKLSNEVLHDTISTALLLADNDHLRRKEIFATLFQVLFSSEDGILLISGIKKFSYFITKVQQANDNIDGKRVMPFIQFCLKSLNENGGDIEEANSCENLDLRMQFLTLKNSLTIMNHFRTNGKKEEY